MASSAISLQNIVLRLSGSSSLFFKWLHIALTRLFKFPRRTELPATLFEWKDIGLRGDSDKLDKDDQRYEMIWQSLEPFFGQYRFTLFQRGIWGNQSTPDYPAPSNYVYYPVNMFTHNEHIRKFCVPHGIYHAARKDGRHFAIRVISAGGQGLDQLEIWRMLSNTVPDNLYSNYHILPMVEELVYHDITFGIFPFAFGHLKEILNPRITKSTLEEALHLIMQALEAIIYIHGKNIAHRDLYTDNFLVDFVPNALVEQHWAQPRVYLSDFETAIHFPDDSKPSERLVSGFPFRDFGLDLYNRTPPAPELLVSETHAYCPFQLDMFQFGSHLNKYLKTTGFEDLDSLWPPLMAENPADRPKPHELYNRIADFLNSTPPRDLQQTWAYASVPVYLHRPNLVGW